MKLAKTPRSAVQSQGTGAATRFSIQASAHAFNMLSSGLYSDKIAAVLREIGCNAADAHAVAGIRNVPFEVKLPTEFDSEFYIQDWGPGLDEAGVRHLYTTYFSSTKQDSDDVTGAFGLGSKSPFSYTDSFTVTACHGGLERVFIAYRDEEGNPLIKSIGEPQPVSKHWKTGVRVGFAVNRVDFDEFRTKAVQVFQWFSPLPNIKGLAKSWKPEITHWLDDEVISISSKFPGKEKSLVLMGNVAYPLEIAEVFQKTDSGPGKNWIATEVVVPERRLAENAIVLKVPIGAVQVAASREVLQYSEGTREALRRALSAAMQHLRDEAVTRFYRAWKDNLGWQRQVAIHTEVSALPRVFLLTGTAFITQGLSKLGVPPAELYASKTHQATQAVPSWVTTDKASGLTVKLLEGEGKVRAKASLVHVGMRAKGKKYVKAELACAATTCIYVGDVDHAEERAVLGHQRGVALLVTQRGRDKHEAERIAKQISAEMGGVPVINVSTLEELKPKALRVRTKVDLLQFSTYTGQRDRWMGTTESVELRDVPENCRFFLVRDGAALAQKTLYPLQYLDDEGLVQHRFSKSWEELAPLLTDGMKLLRRWKTGQEWLPAGFILVPPTVVARMGLLAEGFRPLMGALRDVMSSADFAREATRRAVAGMPFRNRRGPGAAGVFAFRCLDDADFGRVFLPLLEATVRELLDATQTQQDAAVTDERVGLERAIGPLWEFLDLERRVFMSSAELVSRMENSYPAFELFDAHKLNRLSIEELQPAMQAILAAPVGTPQLKLVA